MFKPMRVGVRVQFPWVEAGGRMVAVRVLNRWTRRGYRTFIICRGGLREVRGRIANEVADALWSYPVLGSVINGDDYTVELAVPVEVAEKWGVLDCVKTVRELPREYPVIVKK
jgi:hypothetical protein